MGGVQIILPLGPFARREGRLLSGHANIALEMENTSSLTPLCRTTSYNCFNMKRVDLKHHPEGKFVDIESQVHQQFFSLAHIQNERRSGIFMKSHEVP